MDPRAAYEQLLRRGRENAVLGSCSAVLGWDEQTYMPPGGAAHRGEQMALLAGLHHERATDPKVGELLAEVEGSDVVSEPDSPEAANVREIRRSYDRLTKLPRVLVEELARAASLAQQEWVVARREDRFEHFRPWLETMVTLKRQQAECLGFEEEIYDALLDEYEPGARSRPLAA
jgi:carboxypeptidase Taq